MAPPVEASIAVPKDSSRVIAHLTAKGTQNYECTSSASDASAVYAWKFAGFAAVLSSCDGERLGDHGVSEGVAVAPRWSATDGSYVVGRKVAAASPSGATLPWLLVEATSHSEAGLFSGTRFIQRVNTVGGASATDGCNATAAGKALRVEYSADYFFFGR